MFEPKAWFRAVVADDVPVGFVMLSVDTDEPEYYLWRFMIDERYQGRGVRSSGHRPRRRPRPDAAEGDRAAGLWVAEPGGPEPFYRGLGFEPTGEVDEGEVVARLRL